MQLIEIIKLFSFLFLWQFFHVRFETIFLHVKFKFDIHVFIVSVIAAFNNCFDLKLTLDMNLEYCVRKSFSLMFAIIRVRVIIFDFGREPRVSRPKSILIFIFHDSFGN